MTAAAINIIEKDQEARNVTQVNDIELMLHASKTSGRSPLQLAREFLSLRKKPGRISFGEYIQYGVYRSDLYDRADQEQFLSNLLHWPITHACCDMTWQATTEDKWLCNQLLAQSDVPIPQTLAVIDKTDRAYPATRKISTAADFKNFLMDSDSTPFFGKENRGICSFGAMVGQEGDGEKLRLLNHGWVDYETVMGEMLGTAAYILQPLIENHSFFAPYTQSVATVRVCILLSDNGIQVPFTVLKVPASDNLADSFWRPGNLACGVDPVTGEIFSVRKKTPYGIEDVGEQSTETSLKGKTLPFWDELLAVVHKCAPIFAPVRYQSMDIAITENGPVVIEVNTGGGFDLPQYATGKGFLTEQVSEFFIKCGYKFK